MGDQASLQLPPGKTTVRVKLINPVNFGPAQIHRFMAPPVLGLTQFKTSSSHSFYIEHPSGRKLVFDLGIRKDYENYSKKIAEYIPTTKYSIDITRDVADTLCEAGIKLKEVEAVIWSHWHWDHIGDPSKFPSNVDLVVGSGFKDAMLPGFPSNPDSPIRESDYADRNLREIAFDGDFKVGQFPAFDYFGDGSFYLLDSPGHATGHLCGLARTTTNPDTFVLLGGDICHYAGIFRPSKQLPVSTSISPHPCRKHTPADISFCPGTAFEELQRLRGREPTDAMYDMTLGHDVKLANTQ